MSNYEATKYDFDGANLTGIEGIPTATIVPWSDSSIPSGFLECNGAAVSRSTYAALFAVVGTTYGAGDGSSTFNVPDLQDNVAVGKSGTKALASTGGANTVTPSINNTSITDGQLASHSHTLPNFPSGGDPDPRIYPVFGGGKQSPNVGNRTTATEGSDTAHGHNANASSVLQPYIALIYIIKT
jgi:microcystin-dependent protein